MTSGWHPRRRPHGATVHAMIETALDVALVALVRCAQAIAT